MIWIFVSIVVAILSVISMLVTKLHYAKKLRDIEVEVCGRIEKEIISKVKENEYLASHLAITAAVIERQRNFNTSQVEEVIKMGDEIRDQRTKVMAIHNDNMALLERARQEIKNNKQQHFYVKESSLWLYDHYKRVVELLDQIIKGETNYQGIFAIHETATTNMLCVRDYFIKYFNTTPENYGNQKVFMTDDKGDELKFSKN